ncbi:MAG: carboxylesterase [Gammaproteobacteria bacterium CG_4_10_14_0_8_um_filter_38_16]|nr:MAG: carboxylesterase [Gammaproteobacteria bacterium CG_4_10_14_0_8_um_filter_38_16]PJA03159.1 MAG: carboxylesterase [Gammaproteobacteria bacterium CG_4_10_14_0_2_um_filter_38_22]PJB10542.1 MAG: carboxylesterase [Gammaproteobacteria bacterium CG_4_9_14_3_um_filter_38_9]
MTQKNILETHIINPNKKSKGSVIWMHGLGANNHDFDSLIPALSNDALPLRLIFPNAPIRPVTINHQMPTRAWYDIFSLTDLSREDKLGIGASQEAITQLIQDEIAQGVPAHRIMIAGFSQGGAMALYTGIRQIQPIAGILALSCYLPLLHEHAEKAHPKNTQTPIFMAHGVHDMTLPCFAGKMSYDIVRRTHNNAQWQEYVMGHEITPSEIQDIQVWLKQVFV